MPIVSPNGVRFGASVVDYAKLAARKPACFQATQSRRARDVSGFRHIQSRRNDH